MIRPGRARTSELTGRIGPAAGARAIRRRRVALFQKVESCVPSRGSADARRYARIVLGTDDDPAVVVLGDDVLLHERGPDEHGHDAEADGRSAVVAMDKRRPPVGVLVALLVGLAALIAFDTVGAGEDEEPPDTTVPSTTIVPAPTPASALDGFESEIRLVVSAPGEPAQLMRWAPESHRPSADMLPELEEPRFDRSGHYVAGLVRSSANRGSVLWVGPVDGELEPVATRVGSFAWHDMAPGRIGWTELDADDDMRLMASDIGELDRLRLVSDIDTGRLRSYGPWGFALSVPGDSYRTRLLDLRGSLVDVVRGYPVGTMTSGKVVFSGGIATGSYGNRSLRFADGSRMLRLDDIDDGDAPFELHPGPGGELLVLRVNHGGLFVGVDSSSVQVLDRNGVLVHEDRTLHGGISVEWSPDGRYVVLAGRAADGAEVVLVDTETGRSERLRVPGLPPGSVLEVADLTLVEGSAAS